MAGLSPVPPRSPHEDPGPAAYAQALKGKRVMLVPMAMGFDLAQGWAALPQAEVEGFGRHLRDPRSELERRSRRPGDHRRDLVRSQARRAGRPCARPQLLCRSCSRRRRQQGIYVILIDNPANFAADAFIGSDWDRLGQLEAEAAVKGCGDEFVEEDRPGAGRPGQCLEPLSICRHHEGAGEASRLQGRGQARFQLGRDDRAQRDDDHAAAESRHLRHHRLLGRRRHRAPRRRSAMPARRARSFLVTTGGGEKADCDKLQSGDVRRGGDDRAARTSRGDMNAIIKFLLQSGQPAGTSKTYIYTLEKADHEGRPQARHLLGSEGAAGRAAQVSASSDCTAEAAGARPAASAFSSTHDRSRLDDASANALQRWRYNLVPDHLIGEILTKRWADNAIPFLALVVTVVGFGIAIPGFFKPQSLQRIRPASSASSRSSSPASPSSCWAAASICRSARSSRCRPSPPSPPSSSSSWPVWVALAAALATGVVCRRHQRLSHRLSAAAGLSHDAGDLHHRPRALRHPGGELRRRRSSCRTSTSDVWDFIGDGTVFGLSISVHRGDRRRHHRPCRAHPLAARLACAGGRRLAPLGPQFRHPGPRAPCS